MTRKEVHVLAALIVVIAAGLGVRAWEESQDAGAYVLVEQDRPSDQRHFQPENQSPPRAYSSGLVQDRSLSDREMYGENGRLDLNLADATALDALPRIGPSRADAIIEWRKQNGSFSTTRDLLEIHGIGEKTLELLEPLIFVESTEVPATQHNEGGEAGADKRAGSTIAPNSGSEKPIAASENTGQEENTKIDINSAGQEKLEDLWNIGPAKARAIIEWRQTNGPFRDIEQIQEVPGIGPSTLERNRDRLICR